MFRKRPKEQTYFIRVDSLEIEVSKKRIKNLYVRVHRTTGKVRISCPVTITDRQLSRFVYSKLKWIKAQVARSRLRKELVELRYIDGEEHEFLGDKFILRIYKRGNKKRVYVHREELIVESKKELTKEEKSKLIDNWYRVRLKKLVPGIIEKYEAEMKVKVIEFGIKKMKTRWGTCNIEAHRIWLSLELAKKPLGCLEMVVVHEMVHLLERLHSKKFYSLMDQFMPNWKEFDKKLISEID